MNKSIKKQLNSLGPYKGILYFLFLLFFFHFSWKIAIDGDMDGDYIYLFGKDITPEWFFTSCRWLTLAVAWFIRLFPDTDSLLVKDVFLHFPGTSGTIKIIWGCTGIKQMSIFTGIMIFYFGPWKKKLWYIPMGYLILSVYNIIRIAATCLLTKGIEDRESFMSEFDSLHDGILRYIYYTIIFLLWVCWEEFINKKQEKKENEKE
jgi:exosortase/archaeosortase family protein